MNWMKVTTKIKPGWEELLIASFSDLPISGYEIENANDFLEFLDNKEGNWDYYDDSLNALKTENRLTVYLPNNEAGAKVLASMHECVDRMKKEWKEIDFSLLSFEKSFVKEEDWSESWKKHFHAFRVGKSLRIEPSWNQEPSTDTITLTMDPGSVFGSGLHETTQLALELLEMYVHPNDRVLDYGTGSGILSIAAVKLGAISVVACDIDPGSETVFQQNMHNNQISSEQFTFYHGDIRYSDDFIAKRERFDILIMNIVADVICEVVPFAMEWLNKGSVVILSGIIEEKRLQIEQLASNLQLRKQKEIKKGAWHAYAFQKLS